MPARRFPPPWSIEDIGAAAGLLEITNQIGISRRFPHQPVCKGGPHASRRTSPRRPHLLLPALRSLLFGNTFAGSQE
jgi:hypothetical protein